MATPDAKLFAAVRANDLSLLELALTGGAALSSTTWVEEDEFPYTWFTTPPS